MDLTGGKSSMGTDIFVIFQRAGAIRLRAFFKIISKLLDTFWFLLVPTYLFPLGFLTAVEGVGHDEEEVRRERMGVRFGSMLKSENGERGEKREGGRERESRISCFVLSYICNLQAYKSNPI